MQASPYTPGEVAREVPGRQAQLVEIDERLSYLTDLGRLVGRIRVDTGARGLGKTSLLREIERRAQSRGALSVWVTAGEPGGLIPDLVAGVDRIGRTWRANTWRSVRERLNKLKIELGVPGVASAAVELDTARRDRAPSGARALEDLIRLVVDGARKDDHPAVVFFVDEIQAADVAGLRSLAYAWQHLQSEAADLPVALFAAGLPDSPETIASAVTFSERFAFRPLARLEPAAVEAALVVPARRIGVHWHEDALRAVITAADGYPYAVQLYGNAVWTAAGHPDAGQRLTAGHVATAETTVRAELDSLFRGRWAKASPNERTLLVAMAQIGDRSIPRAELSRRLGVTSQELSVTRARLIDKGLIASSGQGLLDFTVPGFAAWIRQSTPDAGE